jgi:hypothetical protein
MTPLHLVAGIGVIFAALFLYGLVHAPADRAAGLRQRYLKLLRLTQGDGEAQLADRLESLSRRFPGRSYRWYLAWLVRDLERAKR